MHKVNVMSWPLSQPSGAEHALSQGRFIDRIGGLGGIANQAYMRASASAAHACWLLFFLFFLGFLLVFYFVSFFLVFLFHSIFSFLHFCFRFLFHFAFYFLLLSSSLLFIGCATTLHRDKVIITTLKTQNVLLEKIQVERRALRHLKLLESSASFRVAEGHLEESINALKASNEAISSALSIKSRPGGNYDK